MVVAVIAPVAMAGTASASVANAKIADPVTPANKVQNAQRAASGPSAIARTKFGSSVPKSRLTRHCHHLAALSKRRSHPNRVSNNTPKPRLRPGQSSLAKKEKAVGVAAEGAVAVVVAKGVNHVQSRMAHQR